MIGSGVFEGAKVEFPTFPLTCVVVLKTLWHYVRASVWYRYLDRSFFCFVTIYAFDRWTDGRIDRILIAFARPRLHFMQRGKNVGEGYAGLAVESLVLGPRGES